MTGLDVEDIQRWRTFSAELVRERQASSLGIPPAAWYTRLGLGSTFSHSTLSMKRDMPYSLRLACFVFLASLPDELLEEIYVPSETHA